MLVFLSNSLTCIMVLLIAMLFNGDWGTKKMPFYGLLRHHRFLQQPYSLLYFFVVSSFIERTPNSINGLWLFLFLLVGQIGLVLLIYAKFYRKTFLDWRHYVARISQIVRKSFDKNSSQNTSKLTLQDIIYFLQNFVFPSVFMLANAYLIVQIFIH